MIFYFHGFASSSRSWKASVLKKQFPDEELCLPTLPVKPADVVDFFLNIQKLQGKPDLLLGSSLGGFYAYYSARRFSLPAVLINPSLVPWKSLAGLVGTHKRFYTGESFEWKEEYLTELRELSEELDLYPANQKLLHFFLSADDEVLDHSPIPTLFPEAGLIKFFQSCGHGFTRFEEIIPEIKTIKNRFKTQDS
jgi:predicted esterase YcpF (UPF0227 family)